MGVDQDQAEAARARQTATAEARRLREIACDIRLGATADPWQLEAIASRLTAAAR